MKAVLRKNGHSTDFYCLVWPKAEIKEFAKPFTLQAEAFCKILPLVGLNPTGILPNIIIPHMAPARRPISVSSLWCFVLPPTLLATPHLRSQHRCYAVGLCWSCWDPQFDRGSGSAEDMMQLQMSKLYKSCIQMYRCIYTFYQCILLRFIHTFRKSVAVSDK